MHTRSLFLSLSLSVSFCLSLSFCLISICLNLYLYSIRRWLLVVLWLYRMWDWRLRGCEFKPCLLHLWESWLYQRLVLLTLCFKNMFWLGFLRSHLIDSINIVHFIIIWVINLGKLTNYNGYAMVSYCVTISFEHLPGYLLVNIHNLRRHPDTGQSSGFGILIKIYIYKTSKTVYPKKGAGKTP